MKDKDLKIIKNEICTHGIFGHIQFKQCPVCKGERGMVRLHPNLTTITFCFVGEGIRSGDHYRCVCCGTEFDSKFEETLKKI